MKTELLTQSVYLTTVLLVTAAVSGCAIWPGKTTYDTPEKPNSLKEGKTHKTVVLEKLGNPDEQTEDGRLALHDYTRTRRWHGWFPFNPIYGPDPNAHVVDEFHRRFLLLVVYDENDIVKRLEKYKCNPKKYNKGKPQGYRTGDPLCSSQNSICGVLVATDDPTLVKRYCDAPVVDHIVGLLKQHGGKE